MNRNIKSYLLLLLVLILATSMILMACDIKEEIKPPTTSDGPDTLPVEGQAHAPVRDLVLSYLSNEYASEDAVYFASDEPEGGIIGFGWITRDSQLYVLQ